MDKLRVKKLIVLFLVVTMIVLVGTKVEATSGAVNPLTVQSSSSSTTSSSTSTTTTPTPTPTTSSLVTTPTPTKAPTATPTVVSSYGDNSNLPNTGDAEDFIVFLVIALAVAGAIYAFRRYRNYNI